MLGQNQMQSAHGCCWFEDDDYGCYGDCGDDDDGDDIDGVEEQIQDQASHPSSLAHLVLGVKGYIQQQPNQRPWGELKDDNGF